MQIRNKYEKELLNGEIGIVAGIDPEEDTRFVDYPGLAIVREAGVSLIVMVGQREDHIVNAEPSDCLSAPA